MSDIIKFQSKDGKLKDEYKDMAQSNHACVVAHTDAGFTREEAVLILLKLMETED